MTTALLYIGVGVCVLELIGWAVFIFGPNKCIDKSIKRNPIEILLVTGIFVIAAVLLVVINT